MISILTPTRGRPSNVERLVVSARSTADKPEDLEFVFYVDDDDEAMLAYIKKAPKRLKFIVGPREVLSRNWNTCFEYSAGEILMHCGDDIEFQTAGWDSMVREAFESSADKLILVHGDDGNWGEDFGTHCFLYRKWAYLSGFFVPPYFVSDYNDTWLNDVANALERRVYLPFKTEHYHPVFGKAEWDATHKERMARHRQEDPERLYKSGEMQLERSLNVETLQKAIDLKTKPSWDILICALETRAESLGRLLDRLAPQLLPYAGKVKVKVLLDNFELSRSEARQKLLDSSTSKYVCYVDDDDMVPEQYVARVYDCLGTVDYVGWRMRCEINGVFEKPTFHSITYPEWHEDEDGWYRHISHLNPIRRSIAKKVPFHDVHSEDVDWSQRVWDTCLVKSEAYIPQEMYFYNFTPAASMTRPGAPRRPVEPSVRPQHKYVEFL